MNISKGNILMFCEHDEFGEERELATHGLNVDCNMGKHVG